MGNGAGRFARARPKAAVKYALPPARDIPAGDLDGGSPHKDEDFGTAPLLRSKDLSAGQTALGGPPPRVPSYRARERSKKLRSLMRPPVRIPLPAGPAPRGPRAGGPGGGFVPLPAGPGPAPPRAGKQPAPYTGPGASPPVVCPPRRIRRQLPDAPKPGPDLAAGAPVRKEKNHLRPSPVQLMVEHYWRDQDEEQQSSASQGASAGTRSTAPTDADAREALDRDAHTPERTPPRAAQPAWA